MTFNLKQKNILLCLECTWKCSNAFGNDSLWYWWLLLCTLISILIFLQEHSQRKRSRDIAQFSNHHVTFILKSNCNFIQSRSQFLAVPTPRNIELQKHILSRIYDYFLKRIYHNNFHRIIILFRYELRLLYSFNVLSKYSFNQDSISSALICSLRNFQFYVSWIRKDGTPLVLRPKYF